MNDLKLYYYQIHALRNNDWWGFSGYIFAPGEPRARELLVQKYVHEGVKFRNSETLRQNPYDAIKIIEVVPINISEGMIIDG